MADLPQLKLYNTLTRSKEPFQPLDSKNVRMYVCGPTVYDFAHIGNARPVIVFDVLFRLLKHLAKQGVWDGGKGETKVTYVRNITDIDDKINKRAFERWTRKRPLLDEVKELTEGTAAQYEADVAALGCLPPTHSPRATDFVCNGAERTDMVRVIEALVAKGFAYAAEGHVLFEVAKMPNYGALSRRPLDDMIAGARVEVAPYKKSPMDFVLWKPSDPETEPGWDSPWGFGRPGWHIECSAMSGALLGDQFDIHAGGLDLIFPHHENEIAQSCCAFGVDKMASVWMHNGFLQVEGQKMSKSLGNFKTIREVLNDWPGEVVRLNMLKTHYRQPIDWTVRGLEESANKIARYRKTLDKFGSVGISDAPHSVIYALCDDLNTHAAISAIDQLDRTANGVRHFGPRSEAEELSTNAQAANGLRASLMLLGFDFGSAKVGAVNELFDKTVAGKIETRLEARRAKNFAESDRIRDELLAMGIQLKDGKDEAGNPTTTWEVKR